MLFYLVIYDFYEFFFFDLFSLEAEDCFVGNEILGSYYMGLWIYSVFILLFLFVVVDVCEGVVLFYVEFFKGRDFFLFIVGFSWFGLEKGFKKC